MAFTTPRTWTDGELVTKAIMDPHVRDNFLAMGPHLIARKTADQNVTSTTYANDDTLATPSIPANEIWHLRLVHSVTTGAGGMNGSWSFPTSGDLQMIMIGDSGSVLVQQKRLTASDGDAVNYIINASAARLYVMDVLYINAGTAGIVTRRNALTSASGTSVVKANSTLWGVRLA